MKGAEEAEPTYCNQCGGPMVHRIDANAPYICGSEGWFCERCGWSVVTTHVAPILRDSAIYVARVINADANNREHLRIIAAALGVNLVQAKALIASGEARVSGAAVDISRLRDLATSAGLALEITPDFPW